MTRGKPKKTLQRMSHSSMVECKKKKKIQKEHLQQSTLYHNNSHPVHCIIFIMDGGSAVLD